MKIPLTIQIIPEVHPPSNAKKIAAPQKSFIICIYPDIKPDTTTITIHIIVTVPRILLLFFNLF